MYVYRCPKRPCHYCFRKDDIFKEFNFDLWYVHLLSNNRRIQEEMMWNFMLESFSNWKLHLFKIFVGIFQDYNNHNNKNNNNSMVLGKSTLNIYFWLVWPILEYLFCVKFGQCILVHINGEKNSIISLLHCLLGLVSWVIWFHMDWDYRRMTFSWGIIHPGIHTFAGIYYNLLGFLDLNSMQLANKLNNTTAFQLDWNGKQWKL